MKNFARINFSSAALRRGILVSSFALAAAGCFEVPVWEYKKYGISATEWTPNEINDIEFDLNNTAITSLVFTVDGKEYWFRDKQTDLYKALETSYGGFVAAGTSWAIFSDHFRRDDGCIVSANNCSSNTVIYVKMNGIELTVRCTTKELLDALGEDYEKVMVPRH